MTETPLPVDRWLEMDLTWFDPTQPFEPQIDLLLERVAPLWTSVSGWRGLVFNVGWLIDLVTEWTGNPAQPLPTLSRRTALWAKRSYADLRAFLALLRERAARRGFPDLKIGVLFVGWAHVVWPPELKIYDFDSTWYARHPELYDPPRSIIGMPELHPIKRLHGDDYTYAAFPDGLTEGVYFPDFFGAQWGQLAAYLKLDLILLRDGLTGPMIYSRNGPFGTRAPSDPTVIAQFSQSVRDLYRALKSAAPDKLVFGYSSAISPIADWRVGCVDFEALVGDGFIDGWIEQTWGGAWQDWWHQLWKGWTFQAANLLTRGAMIAAANRQRTTPCRFYNLIETWDGWEPWDTLHQVPYKLRWAMWAFTHGSVSTSDGLRPPDGSYISWMNNGAMELLSPEDVAYVEKHLTAAQANALALERVYGWTLVYNRALIAWLAENHPDSNVGEWLDDQAGLLMKWGVPISSITQMDWLGQLPVLPEALIASVPGQLSDGARATLQASSPLFVIGRVDVLDDAVRARLGLHLSASDALTPPGFYVSDGVDAPPFDRPYLPEHAALATDADVEVLYQTRRESTPLLTRRDDAAYWQPSDWSEPFNPFLPKYQLGSTFPHYRAAMLLHELARAQGLSHLAGVERAQPIAFHLWRSGGSVYVLLGNLETGELGDSRTPRQVTIWLSRAQLDLTPAVYTLVSEDRDGEAHMPVYKDERWLTYYVTVPPESGALYHLERSQ